MNSHCVRHSMERCAAFPKAPRLRGIHHYRSLAPARRRHRTAASDQLAEVVVTAEKRSEDVQKVPIAITAFNAQELQDRGVTDIHALSNLTPNVNLDAGSPFSGSSSVLSASIRGIGQDDFAMNLDPGVGVYVDGVYLARTVGANQNLLDVDRVEILKGPQGTLFGRNTIGGAISIVTHTPGSEFSGKAELTTGSFARRDLAATFDIPITDRLLSSITVSSLVRDGYQRRIATPGLPDDFAPLPETTYHQAGYFSNGNTQGGQNQQVVRAKLLYLASDSLKWTFTADWTHENQTALPNTVLATTNGTAAGGLVNLYNTCTAVREPGWLSMRPGDRFRRSAARSAPVSWRVRAASCRRGRRCMAATFRNTTRPSRSPATSIPATPPATTSRRWMQAAGRLPPTGL